MITAQEISDRIAECETVEIDVAELDVSGFFSIAEREKRKIRIKKIMEGIKNELYSINK